MLHSRIVSSKFLIYWRFCNFDLTKICQSHINFIIYYHYWVLHGSVRIFQFEVNFFYRRSAGPAVDMCGKSLYIDLNELQTYRRDQPQPQPKGNLLKDIDNKTAQIFYITNFWNSLCIKIWCRQSFFVQGTRIY